MAPPSPTTPQHPSSTPHLLPTSSLTASTNRTLRKILLKAEKKHLLSGNPWLRTLLPPSYPLKATPSHSYSFLPASPTTHALASTSPLHTTPDPHLIRRTLLQNAPLYSSEALTILSIDAVYAFKLSLRVYALLPRQATLIAAVEALRCVAVVYGADPPIQSAYLERVYDYVGVDRGALRRVAGGWRERWGGEGVGLGMEMEDGLEEGGRGGESPLPLVRMVCPTCEMGGIQDKRVTRGVVEGDLSEETWGEWQYFLGGKARKGGVVQVL